MKFCLTFILTLALPVPGEAVRTFSPARISYEALVNDQAFEDAQTSFTDALTDVGLISVTDVPSFDSKMAMLSSMHECAKTSVLTQEHQFADGTRRRTMATHTIPGHSATMSHGSDACDFFTKASDDFRKIVTDITFTFSKRLTEILDLQNTEKPMLATEDGEHAFDTFADVVFDGHHLEHFHSYQRTSLEDKETIEIHTDQGLFIAFTPGLIIDTQDKTAKSTMGSGFYIELDDGARAMVDFTDQDDLVFMLGDAINEIVNARVRSGTGLRPTPHALTMPKLDTDLDVRVWYGRMVLPPSDALHPVHNDKTYELLRQGLNKGDAETLHLGCSSTMVARNLEHNECGESSIYCWHRCMNVTEFGVSEETCAAQELDLRCVNPRGQLYIEGHGDYFPACVNSSSAENVTEYPKLESYPRDEAICTDAAFQTFASAQDYDYTVNLGNALLSWTVVDGMIDGRLSFNGLFGWLALGFANPDGHHNGMNGASIMMALPGDNYDAAIGLDTSLPATVNEYVIDPVKTAFRHWKDPVVAITRSTVGEPSTVTANECFTAITFKTDTIYETKFNFTGTNDLIWAAEDSTYFVGYHGRENRARFMVDWTNGNFKIDNGEEEIDDTTSAASSTYGMFLSLVLSAFAALFLL